MQHNVLMIVVVSLTACASATPTPVAMRPTATPKIDVLKSPDGVIRANTVCYQAGMYSSCFTKFSNNEMIRGVPGDWSPDNFYAVVCIGATHDSPCSGFEVWDMANGKKQAELAGTNYCYMWSPSENHQIVYVYHSVYLGENQAQLYSLDAATGLQDRLTAYPDWFKPDWDVTGVACRESLDVVVGSEAPMFLTTPIVITLVPSATPAGGYP